MLAGANCYVIVLIVTLYMFVAVTQPVPAVTPLMVAVAPLAPAVAPLTPAVAPLAPEVSPLVSPRRDLHRQLRCT